MMRWICKDDIEECLTENWRTKAAEMLKKLQNAPTPEKRKKILKSAQSTKVWRDFYAILPPELKKKCWYCEAEEIRSDMPVDHFRPKNKVEEVMDHEGYWWLAFDWENYRCACTFCNSRREFEGTSGGKQCKFPLVDPTKRAFKPEDRLEAEEPALLDPFDPDDWRLLWFDNDGKPQPIPGANNKAKLRVDKSIETFHLHEAKLTRERNKVRISILNTVKELGAAKSIGDQTGQRNAKSKLMRAIRDTEKLSRAALVYMCTHRAIPEVKEILLAGGIID